MARSETTPMMEQYHTIKEQNEGCLLFFRMGDFYELFFDDAIIAAKTLDIALTKRGREKDQDIPMCGVPFHAYESYLAKLVKAGFKVAICEQMEKPEEAKKRGYKAVVKRAVVRVVTPGTLTEDNLLESGNSNYLLGIVLHQKQYALAYADISTGDLFYNILNESEIFDYLVKLNPREILVSDEILNKDEFTYLRREYKKIIANQASSFFSLKRCQNNFKEFYKLKFLDSLGNFNETQLIAIGSLLEYIRLTQIEKLPILKAPQLLNKNSEMQLDAATIANLEIFQSSSGEVRQSLIKTIDNSKTPMGARMLRKFMISPLNDFEKIQARLDIVDFFYQNHDLTKHIMSKLANIYDIERAIARLSVARGGPRDFLLIANSLHSFKVIKDLLGEFLENIANDSLQLMLSKIFDFSDYLAELKIIANDCPLLARDGGFVNYSLASEISDLITKRLNASEQISALEKKYRAETGVSNLKIRSTNILGYYIEVSNKNMEAMPKDKFIHRQSLANNIRFTSKELLELQEILFNTDSIILAKELEIFERLSELTISNYSSLSYLAKVIAYIDVFASNAYFAKRKNYHKPEMTLTERTEIKAGFHPVVKENLPEDIKEFTVNDCVFDFNEKLHLLTGPNMAGKSTYLRQNAIIILLAHIGLFVPAKAAKISLTDRIFSRIGASDDLARGRSTFMLEMLETAAILNNATAKSFIILDEIGRGTATFDGMALAWAIIEYIHDKLKANCLFATHYHELVELEKRLSALKTYQVIVDKQDERIIFRHKIKAGFAKKSYGIAVAKLAGLPDYVLRKSEEILAILEKNKPEFAIESLPLFASEKQSENIALENKTEISLETKRENELYDLLQQKIINLDLDELSPKLALEKLYELQKEVKNVVK